MQVKEHLSRILSLIDQSKTESVILTGSTSRGELSYRPAGNRLSIYSDYEFLILARGKAEPADTRRLTEAIGSLEQEFSDNPLFHIDFSYLDRQRFLCLPFHLKHYEMRESGKTIWGRDWLPQGPAVTVSNLDTDDLHEILIWRLWQILLHFPSGIIRGESLSAEKDHLYSYVLCRNFLDLATWRLPLRGVLLCGFRNRHQYIHTHPALWQDDAFFDKAFLDLESECMTGKFNLQFSRSSNALYRAIFPFFIKARTVLMPDCPNSGYPHGRSVFQEGQLRQRARDMLYAYRHLHQTGLSRAAAWLFRKKYKRMLLFLETLGQAVFCRLEHQNLQAGLALERADAILKQLNPAWTGCDSGEFAPSWQSLRKGLCVFMTGYFPSLAMKADSINAIVRQSDEPA